MDESEINAVFSEIVRDIDVSSDINEGTVEFTAPIATEPIEHIRNTIVEGLVDQLIAREVDTDDPDKNPASLCEELTSCINKDFRQLPGINFGDTIVASGDTIFILVNEAEEETSFLPILDDLRIVGSLELLLVTEIPAIHTLPKLHESSISYLAETDEAMPTIPFGAAFMLKDAYAIDKEGDTQPLPRHLTVLLPLNYPQLELRRQV